MSEHLPERETIVESIFQDHSTETLEEKMQLIRILSRSSTLPKIKDIMIRSMMSSPDGFFIFPNHSINIGNHLLSNPVAALLCMRYGIEWQIWYRSLPSAGKDVRICDLAACRVAARFYELLPQSDKEVIEHIPTEIAEIILRFLNEDEIPELNEEDFKTLGMLHNQAYPENPIDKESLRTLRYLALPTEAMLMSGGDLRLTVDPVELLNKYGCRPFPRPEALTFASSTATSVSNVAFSKTEGKRQYLIEKSMNQGLDTTLAAASSWLTDKLKKALYLPESSTIIQAPSGTDISFFFAGICQTVFPGSVTHILVASDETGSGVPAALEGRHFSDKSALGHEVVKGEMVGGFRPVSLVRIPLRNKEGVLKSDSTIYSEVCEAVDQALSGNSQPVLHVMDQSKLGYTAPGPDNLLRIEKKYGDQILKMVDNSQLRMDQEDIRSYIDRHYVMTLTGSKYFTGPPFCGAMIIPEKYSNQWKQVNKLLPEGLECYFCKNESPDWDMCASLPESFNLGLYMRWYSAITEIDRYFQTPISLRYLGIEMFCDYVSGSIEQCPILDSLENLPETSDIADPHKLKDRRTIFPFFVRNKERVLNFDETTRLYKLLNKNLAEYFDIPMEDRVATQACHIGQPVKAKHPDGTDSAVIRISLGARVISESWKDHDVSIYFQKIGEQMSQVNTIIRKIEFLVENQHFFNL